MQNAIKGGYIKVPESCERCGDLDSILHGHHDDYSLPLSVRWLCPMCHADWHNENGEGLNANQWIDEAVKGFAKDHDEYLK